jgi:hypothetical protein
MRQILGLALLTISLLSGCAALRGIEAKDSEQLLTAAGFRAEPAESQAQLVALYAAPALKVIPESVDGSVVYRYADPYRCRCFYVGGPAEYAAYARLARNRIAHESREAREWDREGPWPVWACCWR